MSHYRYARALAKGLIGGSKSKKSQNPPIKTLHNFSAKWIARGGNDSMRDQTRGQPDSRATRTNEQRIKPRTSGSKVGFVQFAVAKFFLAKFGLPNSSRLEQGRSSGHLPDGLA